MFKFNLFSQLFSVNLEVGEYTIGEFVVCKQYNKLILNSDGTLKEVFFTVFGKKIPLAEIRKGEQERCEQHGIVRGCTNQEYEQMNDIPACSYFICNNEFKNKRGVNSVG